MRARNPTWLMLLVVCPAFGCNGSESVRERWEQRIARLDHRPRTIEPTARRPIVGGKKGGFLFGGPDGTKRIEALHEKDILCKRASYDGMTAAALHRDSDSGRRWLAWYDSSARKTGQVDLPKELDGFDGVLRAVGSRGEAIAQFIKPVLYAHPRKASHCPVGGYPKPPTCLYYFNTDETACRLDIEAVKDIWFTDSPGFAVIAYGQAKWANCPTHIWLLHRYRGPGRLAWSVRLTTPANIFLLQTTKGFDVSLYHRSERIDFRADASWVAADLPMFPNGDTGYRDRTGYFYEKKYLPGALEQLAEAASLNREEQEIARIILRDFIYDWLDSYIRCDGRFTPEEHAARLARADRRFAALLSDERYKKYLAWRDVKGTQSRNPISFLLMPPVKWHPRDHRRIEIVKTPIST